MSRLTVFAASLLALAACLQPGPTPPEIAPPPSAPVEAPGEQPDTERAPDEVSEEPFGGPAWGFVQASSASGRLVVLRRFPGEERPSFGHHGAPSVWPELLVFDLVSGQERSVDEFVDIDLGRRWLLVLDDSRLWLVDGNTGGWEALPEVDMEADANRCLLPRQGGFSATGKRLGWVRSDGSLQIRDLVSGDQWRVAAQGRLWRGWPDDDGRGAVLIELPAGSSGYPVQGTSCACTWCGRFALSYSTFGWSGPSFEIVAVGEDGTRSAGDPPQTEHAIHGEATGGCKMKASKDDGEALERGPWQWDCSGSAESEPE